MHSTMSPLKYAWIPSAGIDMTSPGCNFKKFMVIRATRMPLSVSSYCSTNLGISDCICELEPNEDDGNFSSASTVI